jgi:hypothetical protein
MSGRDIEEDPPRLWRSETLPQLRPDEAERLVASFLGRKDDAIVSPMRYALSMLPLRDRPKGVTNRQQ